MKERPILFNTEMVRAVLDGRKTMTRRVAKLSDGLLVLERNRHYSCCCYLRDGIGPTYVPYGGAPEEPLPQELLNKACPYGVPGDRLWVKETHYLWGTWEHYQDGDKKRWRFLDHTDADHPVKYPATDGDRFYKGPANGGNDYHCRPSIFMRREYSRTTLEITDVRVERVQEITPRDAQREGDKERSGMPEFYVHGPHCHVVWFRGLWDSINEKRGYGWDKNPWVWVVSFEVVRP